jgi:thiamine biosynthesis lipoprotein
MTTAAVEERRYAFRSMSTDVQAFIVCDASGCEQSSAAFPAVERTFHRAEAVLSRFCRQSELSRLNAGAGRPFQASSLLYGAVAQAIAAAQMTGGLFDPTILPDLEAAGYDRSFELLGDGASAGTGRRGIVCGWQAVQLCPDTRTILLPAGAALDLGGIGKGWTVDRAVRRLSAFAGYALDAGGDIRVGGRQADGSPWTIGIEDPRAPERDISVIELSDGAVATSTVARRRWLQDGRVRHHLIDPRTGRPADTGVLSASVVSGSVAKSETLAKAALLLGPRCGVELLDRTAGAQGMLVLEQGATVQTRGFEALRNAI